MTSVALIGGDGAGKTTVARHLTTSPELRAKYLYLGMSAQSGDHLLPLSRLVLGLKRRAYRRATLRTTGVPPQSRHIPASHYEYSNEQRSSWWVAARLGNRLAEAWYRQLISAYLQLRGYLVVYDRHVLFDAGSLDAGRASRRVTERIYHWLMRSFYPRPDLVILLDASGEVLHGRKGEASPGYLDRERTMYLAQAAAAPAFVRLDATKPLDEVLRDAQAAVAEHCRR